MHRSLIIRTSFHGSLYLFSPRATCYELTTVNNAIEAYRVLYSMLVCCSRISKEACGTWETNNFTVPCDCLSSSLECAAYQSSCHNWFIGLLGAQGCLAIALKSEVFGVNVSYRTALSKRQLVITMFSSQLEPMFSWFTCNVDGRDWCWEMREEKGKFY